MDTMPEVPLMIAQHDMVSVKEENTPAMPPTGVAADQARFITMMKRPSLSG